MDLLASMAEEEHVPMLISVHDLGLATSYSKRIVGLKNGVKVLDDDTGAVDPATIRTIYETAPEEHAESLA